MAARTLYLDTSVIGGYFDEEFKTETKKLFALAKAGEFKLVTSAVTVEEIAGAPAVVQGFFAKHFKENSILALSDESEKLAEEYLAYGVVTEKYLSDAQHVAACVLAGIDLLVSWNFKHLANLQRENAFNGVNLLQGCPSVRIVPPTSLIYGYEEND